MSVGFKFILVPSSGVEPFLSALPALSFFLFRSLSLRFVFAFYTCSKGVLKRIRQVFRKSVALNTTLKGWRFFQEPGLNLAYEAEHLPLQVQKA